MPFGKVQVVLQLARPETCGLMPWLVHALQRGCGTSDRRGTDAVGPLRSLPSGTTYKQLQ